MLCIILKHYNIYKTYHRLYKVGAYRVILTIIRMWYISEVKCK